jgi:hypothetical protein
MDLKHVAKYIAQFSNKCSSGEVVHEQLIRRIFPRERELYFLLHQRRIPSGFVDYETQYYGAAAP